MFPQKTLPFTGATRNSSKGVAVKLPYKLTFKQFNGVFTDRPIACAHKILLSNNFNFSYPLFSIFL
jgi:hypothetical protein